VRWDRQIGLDMNFGPPRMEVREPRRSSGGSERIRAHFARRRMMLRGTHWLVAYPGRWRLDLADGLSVRDSSSVRRLDMAVARLEGEKLEGFAIDPRTGRTTIFFDLGARLLIRRTVGALADGAEELWSLQDRTSFVAVDSDGCYSTGSVRASDRPTVPIGGTEWVLLATGTRRRTAILGTLR